MLNKSKKVKNLFLDFSLSLRGVSTIGSISLTDVFFSLTNGSVIFSDNRFCISSLDLFFIEFFSIISILLTDMFFSSINHSLVYCLAESQPLLRVES